MQLQKSGECPQANECLQPLNYLLTKQYQCFFDFQCPGEYKCCFNNCYVHKICHKPEKSVTETVQQEENVIFIDDDDAEIDGNQDDGSGSGNYELETK